MFEIEILDTRNLTFEEVVLHYEKLPKKRKNKVEKLQNEAQKVVSVESYFLVRKLLKLTGFPDFELGEFGKPFISGKKHFNISHSNGVIAVAVSESEIGVDIEKRREFSETFSNYICSSEELEEIKNSSNKNQTITKLWVQKESLIKLEGKTIGTDLKKVLNNANDYNFYFSEFEDFQICVCQKK